MLCFFFPFSTCRVKADEENTAAVCVVVLRGSAAVKPVIDTDYDFLNGPISSPICLYCSVIACVQHVSNAAMPAIAGNDYSSYSPSCHLTQHTDEHHHCPYIIV
jgi:hypothetical protein